MAESGGHPGGQDGGPDGGGADSGGSDHHGGGLAHGGRNGGAGGRGVAADIPGRAAGGGVMEWDYDDTRSSGLLEED